MNIIEVAERDPRWTARRVGKNNWYVSRLVHEHLLILRDENTDGDHPWEVRNREGAVVDCGRAPIADAMRAVTAYDEVVTE